VAEQNETKLVRRHFLKLSFGILTLCIQAKTLAFLQRLEEVGAWATSDRDKAQVTLVPMAQYLQSRPSLNSGLTLRGKDNGGVLRGQNAHLDLNDSAFFALSHCDGHSTVNEICGTLSAHFGMSPGLVQGDLVTLLDCLYRLDLMTFTLARRLDRQYEVKGTGVSKWETIAA
jgi:hypothetical protein